MPPITYTIAIRHDRPHYSIIRAAEGMEVLDIPEPDGLPVHQAREMSHQDRAIAHLERRG